MYHKMSHSLCTKMPKLCTSFPMGYLDWSHQNNNICTSNMTSGAVPDTGSAANAHDYLFPWSLGNPMLRRTLVFPGCRLAYYEYKANRYALALVYCNVQTACITPKASDCSVEQLCIHYLSKASGLSGSQVWDGVYDAAIWNQACARRVAKG